MDQEEDKRESLKRQEYLDERKILVNEEGEASRIYDKYLLTLSGGAFGLSITVVRYMIPHPVNTWILLISWILFVLAMICTLVSLHTAQAGMRRQMEILKHDYEGRVGNGLTANLPGRSTSILNLCSLIFFGAGVLFLAGFIFVNIHSEEGGMAENRTVSSPQDSSRGQIPPALPAKPNPSPVRPGQSPPSAPHPTTTPQPTDPGTNKGNTFPAGRVK